MSCSGCKNTKEQIRKQKGTNIQTLSKYIKQVELDKREQGISELIGSLAESALIIARYLRNPNKFGDLSLVLGENFQGESVHRIDILAHETLISNLKGCGKVGAVVSEESEEIIVFTENTKAAKYLVAIDPIDGSDNTGANITVGTIFSVCNRESDDVKEVTKEEFLRTGNEQIAAGYFLYGIYISLVITLGEGTHEFTFDKDSGEFILRRENIRISDESKIYSFNEGNYNRISNIERHYIDILKSDSDGRKAMTHRYAASLVADINRLLQTGGIYLYPANSNYQTGKLRLIYEANPLAFIIEQSKGIAVSNSKRVMEIKPDNIHQRTPFVAGSIKEVEEYLNCLRMIQTESGKNN